MGKIQIIGTSGTIEEIQFEVIYNEEELRRILGPRVKLLKELRGKITVVLKKPNGEPLRVRDFPYSGDLIVEVVTSGAGGARRKIVILAPSLLIQIEVDDKNVEFVTKMIRNTSTKVEEIEEDDIVELDDDTVSLFDV